MEVEVSDWGKGRSLCCAAPLCKLAASPRVSQPSRPEGVSQPQITDLETKIQRN